MARVVPGAPPEHLGAALVLGLPPLGPCSVSRFSEALLIIWSCRRWRGVFTGGWCGGHVTDGQFSARQCTGAVVAEDEAELVAEGVILVA